MNCSEAGKLGGVSRSAKKVAAARENVRKANDKRRENARRTRKIMSLVKANPQLFDGLLMVEE